MAIDNYLNHKHYDKPNISYTSGSITTYIRLPVVISNSTNSGNFGDQYAELNNDSYLGIRSYKNPGNKIYLKLKPNKVIKLYKILITTESQNYGYNQGTVWPMSIVGETITRNSLANLAANSTTELLLTITSDLFPKTMSDNVKYRISLCGQDEDGTWDYLELSFLVDGSNSFITKDNQDVSTLVRS